MKILREIISFVKKKSMPKALISLKSKKDQAVRRFHPWIFSNAIKNIEGEVSEGDLVEVYSNKGKLLGHGHYQESGSISIRMVTFGEHKFDSKVISDRIQRAWHSRINLGLMSENNNCFRLIFAEGDGLPGVIADYYNTYVILQFHSSGMYKMKEEICSALMSIKEIKGVYNKSSALLSKYGLEIEDGVLAGEVPEETEVIENGHVFKINWLTGQKTGFFLDQRDSRLLLSRYVQNKKVLNTFSYTGGFSIYALNNGAEFVHSVDSSAPALQILEDNLKLNKVKENKHKSFSGDVMEFIKEMETSYDVIVLDPPAFAKSRSARHNAVQGYKRLNATVMRQMKPGSLLFTFSCSQVVDPALFYHTIVSAGLAAEREIKVLHKLTQPADHPVSLFHPEGEYLKGLVLEIL